MSTQPPADESDNFKENVEYAAIGALGGFLVGVFLSFITGAPDVNTAATARLTEIFVLGGAAIGYFA